MYSIGDYVVYKRDGVCRITDISTLRIPSAQSNCLYYHLKPEKYDGRIYIPVHEDSGMRPMISRSDALRLLDSLDSIPAAVCRARDKKALQQHYDGLMRPNTCEALAQTIKSIHAKYIAASGIPGRPGSLEEQILRHAAQALCEELALALDISEDELHRMLERRLSAPTSD